MSVGSLVVKIGADITGLRGDVSKATQSLGSLQGAAGGLSTALKALGVAAAVKGLADLVKGSMEAIDTSAALSRQLGGTIAGLEGLKLAGADAGVSSDALTSSMEKLNAKLGEAARKGSGEAFDALQKLGLSAQQLSAMDVDERMAIISDRMQELGLSAQGTADMLRQLGIRQGEVSRLMMEGGDAIRAARIEAEALGITLNEVDAAKVEAANDAMDKVSAVIGGIGNRLAVQLAPIIEFVANEFIGLARETNGFRDAIDTAVGFAVKAIGFLGDAVRGVHIVFKTVELAGWALGTALVEIARTGANAFSALADLMIVKVNDIIAKMNFLRLTDMTPIALTGDSEMMKGLNQFADGMMSTTDAVFKQLTTLATSEWPSDKIQKFYTAVQAAAQQAAEKTVAARKQLGLDTGGEGGTEADKEAAARAAKAQEQLRERLQGQLDTLTEFAMTETQLEQKKHAERLTQLNEALDAEIITQERFSQIAEALEEKHMEKMKDLREKGMQAISDVSIGQWLDLASGLATIFSQIGDATSRSEREQFESHKAFAIAQAGIAAAQGIANTLGAHAYPYNLALAGVHAGLAAGQIAAIASQQFKGGGRSVSIPRPGGGGGGGGGGGARSGAPAAAGGGGGGASMGGRGGPDQTVTINLMGDNYSRQSVRALISQINEAVSDGARLVTA